MRLVTDVLFFSLLMFSFGNGVAQEIDPCDIAAGHPLDPHRQGSGKATDDVVTHVAIPACRAAVEREPENARYLYQLGRVLYYWAGANDADFGEAIRYVDAAAKKRYTQAMFVRGLLHKYANEICPAEPLMKAAADDGLKSARITYVDDVTAGRYEACGVSASSNEMRAYLEGASAQISGYYEEMLLTGLNEDLSIWVASQ